MPSGLFTVSEVQLKKVKWAVLECLIVLSCMAVDIDAEVPNYLVESPLLSPAHSPFLNRGIPELPLPVDILPYSRHHFTPGGAPLPVLVPAEAPGVGLLSTLGHAPTSPRLARPLMRKIPFPDPNSNFPPHHRLVGIAPANSNGGLTPSGFAHPPISPRNSDCCQQGMVLKRGSKGCHCVYPIKLDLLLLNVTTSSKWTPFLEELASQLGLRVSQFELINFYVLGLTRVNISMDITPHTGISFSRKDVKQVNSSLAMHRIHFDPQLVGDYKLLNLTWFKPTDPSQAPTPLSHVHAPPLQPPHNGQSGAPNRSKSKKVALGLGIGAGLLIIILVAMLITRSCMSGRGKKKSPNSETEKPRSTDPVPGGGSFPHPTSTRFLAFEELKEATNNFEPASVLGEGGFGKVFKGMLSDGTAVAIKKLSTGGQQGDKEFLVEVEMLSRLHHRNLVKLVGYYSNPNASQNLLCYELVPNGSLEAWLHGPLGINCVLDWVSRMKIALDAARGLAYLHEDSQPCVIHRDFKASNILLENNFHAKVSDFGLAKLAPEGRQTHLSTRVMGTFGYVAPEYAMTGHLLVKSDVYSYGVVLLELLTGRRPVDMSQPSGEENLVTWARPILRDKERLEEIADPRLGGKYSKDDFTRVCTIAAACVASEANQRPTMGEVVQSLQMVQRNTEYQDTISTTSNARPNHKQSSTTYESEDGTSSMFSSGPFSGLSTFDNDLISRTTVFSEDLHEGR